MGEREPRPERPLRTSAQSTIAETADAGNERDKGRARPPVPVGTVLGGRYRLLEALGRGAMGAVYRARDLTLDADVAVKVLDPDVASDPKRVESFRNEVRVARKVTHPNVCRLHDLIEADGLWLITMQYVEGESLAERLRRERVLPVAECVRLLRDIAAGLAAAHEAGVVHRDLKPANVLLLDGDRRAIVADFGIAAETSGEARAMGVAGTRGYMSPEQAAGRSVDARSDVYAFGVLAHRMLTGELPWNAPTQVDATDVTEPPAGTPPDAPPALLAFIDQCLAASAGDRPEDGAALLARLAGVAPGASGAARDAARESAGAASGGVDPTSGVSSGPAADAARGGSSESSVSHGSSPDARPGAAAITVDAGPPARGRRRLATGAGVAALAALALLLWRPWAGAVDTPPPVVGEIAIAATAPAGLAREDAHLVDSLVRLTVAELEDGWGLHGRSVADGATPRSGRADLSIEMWVGRDRKLVVEAKLTGPAAQATRLESISLRPLAADLAAWAARSAVPPAQLRPTAQDLAGTCARSPEAWRLWRRARRESRMQRWSQARALAERAGELDPGFPLAPLELSFSYSGDDRALQESSSRASELAGACPTLAREWWLAFAAGREAKTGGLDAAQKRVDQIMAIADLDPGERLYFQTRWAYALFFGGMKDKGLSLLEWIAEEWPADPAAPKLLAYHHLLADEPDDATASLRYARQALAAAPYDVAVRADLTRALLANGEAEAARAQLDIIERAEPAEKQSALSGGESDNTLVTLRLELGDLGGAERDARRLLLGPATERNQGRAALGAIDLLRGAFASGLDHLVAAYRDCDAAGMQTTAVMYLWRAAWQAYLVGDLARSAELFGTLEPASWRGWARVMIELIAARTGKARERPAALARARTAAEALRPGSPSGMLLAMMVAHESADWRRVLQIDEELRAAGAGEALGPMYLSGDALAATGKPRDAEARFRRLAAHPRAWKEPVTAVRAWRRLGEVRERLGDRAGAVEAYRALLERWQRAPAGQVDVAAARAGLARLGAAPR